MSKKLLQGYLKAKFFLDEKKEQFLNEEKGASDMIVVLVLIVIVIGAAVVFQRELEGLISQAFGKIGEFF